MTNRTLKQQILDALDNDPKIDASKIGVIVDNGVVTLTGRVKSMRDCSRAEEVASQVYGVRAIAQEIKHDCHASREPEDEDIAARILDEFKRDTMIPEDLLQLHVREGCVTVKGEVNLLCQKNAVSQVLSSVKGIVDKVNQIRVAAPQSDSQMEIHIAHKLAELSNVNPDGIVVVYHRGVVTLDGQIESNFERAIVIHAIQSVAGVLSVTDQLVHRSYPGESIQALAT